ncbi:phosphosulfolactate synthase [Chloroflexi bacterium TSY]|nr:phosphosulfolactate synthase [Chloroflexi bacterium TSY]
MGDIFPIPDFTKPRELRQTWLKDVGYDEAPYLERMGLVELADFLEVTGPRLDHVKIVTNQILYSPADWMRRKVATYQQYDVEPYLDHTYFMRAYEHGVVDKAIVAAHALGFRVVEFMNTGDDVTPQQWQAWRQLALDNDMRFYFEYHPLHNWDPNQPKRASSAEEMLRAATPFLEAGAFKMMIDHDAFDLLGEQAADEIGPLIDELGLAKLVFEVDSPKAGRDRWHQHLKRYFTLFGPECNVSNIMPSQAMFVESMREGWNFNPIG